METKLFSLQSPERIAKLYGGNKQKIFQALQSGALRRFAPAPMDQILAAAAADFINQMRDAAQAEAAPQQTVFEQLFAPPAPQAPAGLGAMPQAAAMPPMNPPQPSAGLGAMPEAAAMPAPEAAPPMGMAMGGMVPPYAAGGGLSDLPLPDGMFDEPSNGGFDDGYRGGGLVAFAGGEEVEDEDEEITVTGRKDTSPESYYGYYKDPTLMREQIDALYKPERKYSEQLNKFYTDVLDPTARKARRKEDMWMTLGQIGAKMATTPGSFLQAASAGIGEALPGVLAASKERRAEQRDAIKTLAQNEGLNNKEALDLAKLTLEGTGKYGEFDVKRLDREQQERLEIYKEKMANWRTTQQVGAQIRSAQIGASGQTAYMDKQLTLLQRQIAAQATAQLPALAARLDHPIGLAANEYRKALKTFGANDKRTIAAEATFNREQDKYVQQQVARGTGGMGGGSDNDPLGLGR